MLLTSHTSPTTGGHTRMSIDAPSTRLPQDPHDITSRLRTDRAALGAYVSDASIFRRVPSAVFEPETVDDIRAALDHAREHGLSVTMRGGGTSVAGNAIGDGLVIDTSRYFNRILEIDPEGRTARIQPGVVCDALRAAAAPYRLTYGPDPSTHSRCTVGGMIANNACGSHSLAWGTAADNVVELTIMRPDGDLVTLRRGGTSDPKLDEALRALRDEGLALIRTELGRFPRQVSGFGLQHLLQENGFDTAKAFAGSEGVLGVIVEAVVRLVPVPQGKALAVLAFPTVFDAAGAAPMTRRAGVATSEGMGGDLLDALRRSQGEEAGTSLPGGAAGADGRRAAGGWLYCETVGDSQEDAERIANELVAEFTAHGEHPIVDSVVVADPSAMRELWRIREASAGLVTRLPDGGEAWPSWEDSAVPPENLAAYLRDLYALLDDCGLRGIPFGHFGEGCVHIRISFDLGSEPGLEVFRDFMRSAAELVAGHGGSLSGEHGDGRARSALLPAMYSPAMLDLFRRLKSVFDPSGLLNPGVLVDPEPVDQGIRPAPGQRAKEFIPVHALTKDRGSLVNAVNRCVGVGLCRSPDDAMCPSFQITGDEVHSTRGRARLLSEMFRGDLFPEGTDSEDVKEALDLCLSCRACASECPVNVDMATYKSEFLHQHYSQRRRPMAHYSMGWLPVTARLVHHVPGLAGLINAALRLGPVERLVMTLGGVDSSRSMITFSLHSFQSAARRLRRRDTGPRVILWPDSFTNHLDTEVAEDAHEVLTALGYDVIVPRGFVCCGLTWHSTGQLRQAERIVRHTLDTLGDLVDGQTPLVVLEPSCATMLAEEAPQLLADDPRASLLADQVTTLAQAVDAAPDQSWPFTPLEGPALSQVHCHERSRRAHGSTARVLERLGIREETIQTGCCGMAGNWGFEPGHAEMSRQLGERELMPRIRETDPETPVLADGFSCRTQIKEGMSEDPGPRRRGLHLAQLLRRALRTV